MQIRNTVIIGSSAGGVRILRELFNNLPTLNCVIILIQHMPRFINKSLCKRLNEITSMEVRVAQNGESFKKGRVYIAPSEVHLKIVNNRKVRLIKGDKVNFVCPSIDVTMKSLQKEEGVKFIGIILTGMGNDGADGISYIKKIGGVTIAQNEETSIIYGMPKQAIETGDIDWILPPEGIRKKLIGLVGLINLLKD